MSLDKGRLATRWATSIALTSLAFPVPDIKVLVTVMLEPKPLPSPHTGTMTADGPHVDVLIVALTLGAVEKRRDLAGA
eukprot:7387895-Alexandrium_andersonii.AAC.1